MLQNLADITGSYPEVRIGGTTANHATFVPSQTEAIVLNFTTPGADQPTSLTWGPSWLDTFKNFPIGTKYTVGLSFNSGESGDSETVSEAVEIFSKLNSSLYAFEIGNEFDGLTPCFCIFAQPSFTPANTLFAAFPVGRNESTWNIQEYIKEWLSRADAISNEGIGASAANEAGPLFQVGAFVAPGTVSNETSWTFRALADDGILKSGKVKSYSGHQVRLWWLSLQYA